jgi:hypothetical protein
MNTNKITVGRGIARENLLIGELRPLEVHAVRQLLARDFLDRLLCLPGAVAWRDVARVELGSDNYAHGTGPYRRSFAEESTRLIRPRR